MVFCVPGDCDAEDVSRFVVGFSKGEITEVVAHESLDNGDIEEDSLVEESLYFSHQSLHESGVSLAE